MQLVYVGDPYYAVQNSDTEQCYETNGSRNGEIETTDLQRHEITDHGKWNRSRINVACLRFLNVTNKIRTMSPIDQRTSRWPDESWLAVDFEQLTPRQQFSDNRTRFSQRSEQRALDNSA